MDPHFLCFIEFDGHKYDIIINEDISSVCFENIYLKIQQIIKLALNVFIVFETHIFEVIDNKTGKSLVIQEFSHFIKHLSTIRIHRNAETSPLLSPLVYANCAVNACIEPTVGFTLLTAPQTFASNLVSNAVKAKTGDDFVPHVYYCDVCPESVDKIDPRLNKHKLNLNFESYKRYSDLMSLIKKISDSNCDTISEYIWLNVIPYQMRAFGHKDFPTKLWKNSFEVFLKKYIEVMDVSSNQFVACSLFPFFHEFSSFRFDAKDCINYKKITDLRQKINRSKSNTIPKKNDLTKKERKSLNKLVKRLTDEEEDIKVYNLIVQLIDPTVNYRKKPKKKFAKISEVLSRYGYSSKIYSADRCHQLFYTLSTFYAQNYNQLNTDLDPNLQKIFDLLKIVHILDLNVIWSEKSATYSQLKKISHKREIKQYLEDLRDGGIDFQQTNKKGKTVSKTNVILDKDLTAIDMDLEEKDISEEIRDVKSLIVSLREPSVSGEQLRKTIPRTDPRLNRVNCVSNINSNVIPVPIEKTTSNECNVSSPPTVSKSIGEDKISEDMTRDVKPVISFIANELEAQRVVCSQKSLETTVPRLDPRLKRKNIETCHPSNETIVIPVPTEQTVANSLSVITDSPFSRTQSNTSETVLPLKTSVPSIFDPQIRRKTFVASNHRIESIPLTAQHIIEKVNKTKPIITSTALQSTQPSSSLGDPRLKRKLEQQTEETVKQSSVESSSGNLCKKFKLQKIQII